MVVVLRDDARHTNCLSSGLIICSKTPVYIKCKKCNNKHKKKSNTALFLERFSSAIQSCGKTVCKAKSLKLLKSIRNYNDNVQQ